MDSVGNGTSFACQRTTVGCCCWFCGSKCILWCIYRPSNYSMGWGFDSVFADGPDIFGSRVEAMDGKATIMPPVCCILRPCVGIDQWNNIFGLLRDHSYEIVMSKSGYPTMQCEYYCALCNGLPTLLQWFCFVRSWCDQSFKRLLPTALMLWPVAGYATYEWWIVAMMILPLVIFDRRLLWSLVMNWRLTGWWMFLLIQTALLLAQ